MIEYNGQKFITDNDLKIKVLGFWPRLDIRKKLLRGVIGRDFLGGDKIVAYSQSLVSGGMDFDFLEEEILNDIKDNSDLGEIIFKKTSTGIGRGHSLGGLAGIVLGISGTKMIDSGLTGFVASRSLVTSSRRRETSAEEIVIPESMLKRKELLDEYLKISREVFEESKRFKEKFGKLHGIETFNKAIPYNNPADLFIVLPLDTMATLAFEVEHDNLDTNEKFIPKELHAIVENFQKIAKETGMNVMYNQRIKVPRDTYLHYTVFKNPGDGNYALEKSEEKGMPLNPFVEYSFDASYGFMTSLKKVRELFEENSKIMNPSELADNSMRCMLALKNFVNEYNESVRVKIVDSLSWRVWSEQKRHATLRQNVESVYSASDRAYKIIRWLWPDIEKAYDKKSGELDYNRIEKAIVIDERLKENPELAVSYVYHIARQLMFYGKMIETGFERRDALYIVPKAIRLRTLENYDLINLIDLELPLRLCSTCEPERKLTSWAKRNRIVEVLPMLEYFLQPKCRIGFCTEGKYCDRIIALRKYNTELHKKTKEEILSRARASGGIY